MISDLILVRISQLAAHVKKVVFVTVTLNHGILSLRNVHHNVGMGLLDFNKNVMITIMIPLMGVLYLVKFNHIMPVLENPAIVPKHCTLKLNLYQ